MKRVLFGTWNGWTDRIARAIDPSRFHAEFHDFTDPNLAFEAFDVVVPVQLWDYKQLRSRSKQHTNYIIPNEKIVALAHNKRHFNEFLLANGFEDHVPKIYNGTVTYPFLYKKDKGVWGTDVHIISTPEEKAAFEAKADGNGYFKQEYIGGRIEYVLHLMTVKGKPRYALTYEHGFDKDHFIKGKWARYVTHREVETPFLDVFCSILEKLDYTGTACFNFKIVNGVLKIFEMNPRCGATITIEINAYLEAYMGAIEEVRSFERFHRHRFGAGSRNYRELDAAH